MKGVLKLDMLDKVPSHYVDKHDVRRKLTRKQMEENAENFVDHPYLSNFYEDLEELKARVEKRTKTNRVYPKADMSLAIKGTSFQTKEEVDAHLAKVRKNQERLLKRKAASSKPKPQQKTPISTKEQDLPANVEELLELSPQQKAAITRKKNKEAAEKAAQENQG